MNIAVAKRDKRIIGVAAEIGGGKTTFARFAEQKYNASTHRFSTPLREILALLKTESEPLPLVARRLYLPCSEEVLQKLSSCVTEAIGDDVSAIVSKDHRASLQKLSTALRGEFGEMVLAQTLWTDVWKDKSQLVVVEGIRRVADMKSLQEYSGFTLVYIDASPETRYENRKSSGENIDDGAKTFEEFERDCKQESEQQIRALRDHADVCIDISKKEGESPPKRLERFHQHICALLEDSAVNSATT